MPPDTPSARHRPRTGHQAIVDVAYRAGEAFAACLLVEDLSAEEPTRVLTAACRQAAEYKPGELYQRELPPILRVLEKAPGQLDTVVIDAYVWLDGSGRPGLGARLYEALKNTVQVVGVAKTRFGDGGHEELVWRGSSRRPLYVTAAGVSAAIAASWVLAMHGGHRIPTLLQLAHRLARARGC